MDVKVFPDHSALSDAVAAEIIRTVTAKPDALLCLATGDTPLLSYIKTVDLAKKNNVDFSRVRFVALDEWIGVPPQDKGSCHEFLWTHLFRPLAIPAENIQLFDAMSTDLAAECRSVDAFIFKHGPADLMVVGLGMNGHIGFNEPGVSEDLYSHVIELDETTRTVGQKYFSRAMVLTKGITLGFKHILRAKQVILVANGKHKADIASRVVQSTISSDLPASLLRKHPRSYFFIDREAAEKL